MDIRIEYVQIFKKLALDVNLDPFTTKYCVNRIKNEGSHFLVVTLPKLSAAVLRSLELGYFDRTDLTAFAWKGKALRQFRSYLNGIFDLKSGKVLEDVDAVKLWQLRQLCDYFYKLSLPFDDRDLEDAEQKFVSEDASLAGSYDTAFVDQLRKDVSTYYPDIATTCIDEMLTHSRPRSGPGTYSEWRKSWGEEWYTRKDLDYRVNPVFRGLEGYSKPYPGAPAQGEVTSDPSWSEVLFVPKDSRGPRVIVREPYSLLRYQMSYNSWLSSSLTKASQGRINFRDQLINRRLAETASKDRKNSTMDLKSASDRVSRTIAAHVFRDCPAIRFMIKRAVKTATLPVSGNVHSLNKLAGMGSGLTFPTMSFLISLAACRAITDYYRIPYARARALVYVYGDDIICPTHMYSVVKKSLERIKLKVNDKKSFRYSHFRESCGGDYYAGSDVTPIRLKLSNASLAKDRDFLNLSTSEAFLQLEAHCRELVKCGMHNLAELFYRNLEKRFGKLPYVSGESPALGRYSLLPYAYGVTETGNYELIRVLVPVSVQSGVSQDPFVRLGHFFKRSMEKCPLRRLLNPEQDCSNGAVTVPRRVRFVRKSVSALYCMG